MNPRWAKEWRPLRLPASAAAGAALLPLVVKGLGHALSPPVASFLLSASVGVFALAIPLLAATSFGDEFHHRTLGLLLAQPAERFQLWKEKLWMLCALAVALVACWLAQYGLLHWGTRGTSGAGLPGGQLFDFTIEGGDLVTGGLFLAAAVCSAGYWTLVARSTIGGLAFSFVVPFLLLATGVSVLRWMGGPELPAERLDARVMIACAVGAPIYSLLFLRIGWRKFARLELKDTVFAEAASISGAALGDGRWLRWLRCRPTGPGWNLVRKELRLQKPLVMVAGAFIVCWLPVALLRWLPPTDYGTILALLFSFYFPLTILLAGSLSLGEEKRLGLSDWQLTLPFPAWRQWAIKLGVGLIMAFLLGVVVPLVLAWATLPRTLFDLHTNDRDGLVVFSSVFVLAFFLGFWAATLLRNTIQAALAAVGMIMLLVFCVAPAVWLAERAGGLQTGLLIWIMVRFQLPFNAFVGAQGFPVGWMAPILVIAGLTAVVLIQSLIQYRHPNPRRAALVKCAAVLLATAFLGVFWCADFFASAVQAQSNNGLIGEISDALRAYAGGMKPGRSPRMVTLRELEARRYLSPQARAWLNNAVIELNWSVRSAKSDRTLEWVYATVDLPSGKRYEFLAGALPKSSRYLRAR